MAACLASPALAATVSSIQGQVSINSGSGYQRVSGPRQLNAGDQIMVGPNGSAVIVYPGGCTVAVQPGTVVTILPDSACTAGVLATGNNNWVPRMGLNGDQPQTTNTQLLMGLGLVGAAGVGAVILMTQNDDDKPASP